MLTAFYRYKNLKKTILNIYTLQRPFVILSMYATPFYFMGNATLILYCLGSSVLTPDVKVKSPQ